MLVVVGQCGDVEGFHVVKEQRLVKFTLHYVRVDRVEHVDR